MNIYLVRQGDHGPDSSPYPIKAFKCLDSAIKFCKIRQKQLTNKHLNDWPDGSFEWIIENSIHPYYCRSYMTFSKIPGIDGIYKLTDDVLMVQEIEFEE